MSFSSDQPQVINQSKISVNLPSMEDRELFSEAIESLLKDMADSINTKEGGLYNLRETSNSAQYYIESDANRFRNVYRKVLDFADLNGGTIGSSETISFRHEINDLEESAGIFAHCTATSGERFTAVYPDVYVDEESAYFTNPLTEPLSQCDIVINILKES